MHNFAFFFDVKKSPFDDGTLEVRHVVGLLRAEVVHSVLAGVLVVQEGGHLLDGVAVPCPDAGGRKTKSSFEQS